MIVDVHYHFVPQVTEARVRQAIQHALRAAEIMGREVDPEALVKKALASWGDPTGERLAALMDKAGIDVTLICHADNADSPAMTEKNTMEVNRLLGEVARSYPGRVLALAGVDPRRLNAADMMRACFEEFGVRGLKYHPDNGYDPSGPESYRVLEVVAAHNGVLLTHTGPLMPPSRAKFSHPSLLADITVDFPEIKVIAAHMGSIEWRAWANLAAHQPNLYGDLAMWDAYAFGNYRLFCRELRDILDYAGTSKVLFGTDNPIFDIVEPTRNWIKLLKDLPQNAPDGITFTDQEVTGILGGNAARMLGLEQPPARSAR